MAVATCSGEIFSAPAQATETFALLYIQKGQLTLTIGAETQILVSSHSVIARTDAPHHYSGYGNPLTEFIMAVYEPANCIYLNEQDGNNNANWIRSLCRDTVPSSSAE